MSAQDKESTNISRKPSIVPDTAGSRKKSIAPGSSRKQSIAVPKSAVPEQTKVDEEPKEVVRKPHVVPPGMEEFTICCPPGLYRMFFTGATQTAFNIRSEEDITQEDNIRTIQKAQILEDIYKKNVGSDFTQVRKLVEDYPEEDILCIYDYDFQFDKNYYLCLDLSLKEIILNPPIVLPPDPVREPPKYIPPTSKRWVSHGSEIEIDEQNFTYRRPLVQDIFI